MDNAPLQAALEVGPVIPTLLLTQLLTAPVGRWIHGTRERYEPRDY